MSQSNVNTVYGEGFDENKVKARRRIDRQKQLHANEYKSDVTNTQSAEITNK